MSKKNRNKRNRTSVSADSPQQRQTSASKPERKADPLKPEFKSKPFPVEQISSEAWELAKEYFEMSQIVGIDRWSSKEEKRSQKFKERLAKLPEYRQFSAALVRTRRGESPPNK